MSRHSYQRRVDRAATIVAERVVGHLGLDVLSRHAELFAHYQQLVGVISSLESADQVDSDFLAWCRAVLERQNPMRELLIPIPAEVDQQVHMGEIEQLARTLLDPEFSGWTPISFRLYTQQDKGVASGTDGSA